MIPGDTNRVSRTFQVPGSPVGMFFNPVTSRLFIANALQSLVYIVDARRGWEGTRQESLVVGGGPMRFAFSRQSSRVFVANAWDTTVTVIRDLVGIAEDGSPDSPVRQPSVRALPTVTTRSREVRFQADGFTPTGLSVYRSDGTLVWRIRNRSAWAWAPRRQDPAGVYYCRLADERISACVRLVVVQ